MNHPHFIDKSLPVVYAVGEGNYTMLYYRNGTHRLVSYTLGDVLLWSGAGKLIRLSRAVAVSKRCVSRIEYPTWFSMRVSVTHNGAVAVWPVSRRRIQDVREKLTTARPGVKG